jgi:hypothetical protein
MPCRLSETIRRNCVCTSSDAVESSGRLAPWVLLCHDGQLSSATLNMDGSDGGSPDNVYRSGRCAKKVREIEAAAGPAKPRKNVSRACCHCAERKLACEVRRRAAVGVRAVSWRRR